MKEWYVKIFRKSGLGLVYEDTTSALTAEMAARNFENGPVRSFYKRGNMYQFLGVSYLYEVEEL